MRKAILVHARKRCEYKTSSNIFQYRAENQRAEVFAPTTRSVADDEILALKAGNEASPFLFVRARGCQK